MTYAGDSSISARVQAVDADFRAKQRRLFVGFALIEGPILVVAALLIFGLEIVDPDIGIWFIVAIALIGGVTMSMLLVRQMQARTRAIALAKGENPLF